MSLELTAIEDQLHDAGYKTERIGDVVNVHDPVHSLINGKAVITRWELKEIRTLSHAWAFIQDRS